MSASDDSIPDRLLAWYDRNARELPWRSAPGAPAPDPYRVWLSEVMLQQTTTAAVAPYYARFIDRWPTVEALARAEDADVMAAWAGLGYYSRARNLLASARTLADRGVFPDTETDLRKLPGVGAYIAAAVAAIAFGHRAVVIDANVERVVSRLFAIAEPLPAARRTIRENTDAITPDTRAGDFAQAMMDLGATVCTSRDPRCPLCPLALHCRGRAEGNPARFPLRPAKRAKPLRKGVAFWIEHANSVWLVRRPDAGMLGGMRALPDDGWSASGDGSGPRNGVWRNAGLVRHGFSHFDLELSVLVSRTPGSLGAGEWWPIASIGDAGLPTLFAKAAARALGALEDSAAEHQAKRRDDDDHEAEIAPVVGSR